MLLPLQNLKLIQISFGVIGVFSGRKNEGEPKNNWVLTPREIDINHRHIPVTICLHVSIWVGVLQTIQLGTIQFIIVILKELWMQFCKEYKQFWLFKATNKRYGHKSRSSMRKKKSTASAINKTHSELSPKKTAECWPYYEEGKLMCNALWYHKIQQDE